MQEVKLVFDDKIIGDGIVFIKIFGLIATYVKIVSITKGGRYVLRNRGNSCYSECCYKK